MRPRRNLKLVLEYDGGRHHGWQRQKNAPTIQAAVEEALRRLTGEEIHLIGGWDGFRPEQVLDVLATHKPACWDCRVAEGFRREHPELVTDRSAPPALPPSMV